MNKNLLLTYLDGRRRPLPDNLSALTYHQQLLAEAPGLYLELLADTAADVSHRREALTNLIALGDLDRDAILARLRVQPVDEALQVLEGLRRGGHNGRRARGIGLAFLLGHERIAELAATHRTRLVRLFKHLLGERTWSSVVRCLRHGAVRDPRGNQRPGLVPPALLARIFGPQPVEPRVDAEAFLRRTVLRYAKDQAAAREALCALAGETFEPTDPTLAKRFAARRDLNQGAGLPRATLFGLRGTFHPAVPPARVRALSGAAVAAVRDDGPLTGLFKCGLRPGCEPPAGDAVSERLAEIAAILPAVDATLALVVDLSGSAASSGERANHPAALALALTALLRDRVRTVRLYQTGGAAQLNGSAFARPEGDTDLASAVLAAVREQPDVVVVCTDGYENVRQGDTAALIDGTRRLGCNVPVFQVVPLFAATEDLTRRRLGASIPVLTLTHEHETGELLARILLAHAPEFLNADDVARVRGLLFRR